LKDPGVDGRIILKWIINKWNGGASDGLLWKREWTFRCHKMRRISWVAEELLAFHERLLKSNHVRRIDESCQGVFWALSTSGWQRIKYMSHATLMRLHVKPGPTFFLLHIRHNLHFRPSRGTIHFVYKLTDIHRRSHTCQLTWNRDKTKFYNSHTVHYHFI
jgi:hypothetical protein